jgi:hypothetical protein
MNPVTLISNLLAAAELHQDHPLKLTPALTLQYVWGLLWASSA